MDAHWFNGEEGRGERVTRRPPAPRYRIACAWCKKVMREGDDLLPISHSVCPGCADAVLHRDRTETKGAA